MHREDAGGLVRVKYEKLQTCRLEVTGMTSVASIERIESGLSKASGIESVSIALLNERAEVKYDPDYVTPAQIVLFVEALGFGARLIENELSSSTSATKTANNKTNDEIASIELQIEGIRLNV